MVEAVAPVTARIHSSRIRSSMYLLCIVIFHQSEKAGIQENNAYNECTGRREEQRADWGWASSLKEQIGRHAMQPGVMAGKYPSSDTTC